MQIGEVAERTGLSQRSLRYYEEIGLAVPSGRTSAGYRVYAEADVERIELLMRFKPLGFTLEETREVMADLDVLAHSPEAPEAEAVRRRVAAYEATVRDRVASLRQQLDEAEMLASVLARSVG